MEEQPTTPSIFDQAAEVQETTPETQTIETIKINPEDYGINLTDHNAEDEAIQTEDEKDGVAAPQELPSPHTRLRSTLPLKDPVGDVMRAVDPFSSEFQIGKVEVTNEEREQFVRSALHDEEMVFNIHLEGPDIMVKVAIPTEAFTTLAANTLEIWDANGTVNARSNVHWLLTFQQMHAWYQVREFGGKETSWASFFDDGVPKLSKIREHISDFDNLDCIINMSAPRWRMMVNAMALAEYKYKLCLDAWRTRAFFEKADTA